MNITISLGFVRSCLEVQDASGQECQTERRRGEGVLDRRQHLDTDSVFFLIV